MKRLANSRYSDKFVLKGGLYLSSVVGVDTRNTMDIDFYLKHISLSKDTIIYAINDICSINLDDGVYFEVKGCDEIRVNDPYGGFQVKVLGKMENLRYEFGVDIATGDPIVPSDKNYDFSCLVSGEVIPIKAYSLESVIAEKLQTILSRGLANSRCKDFYDLYILRKTQMEHVENSTLRKAFSETCLYRRFSISVGESKNLVKEMIDNPLINSRWLSYTRKQHYANGLIFSDVIKTIDEWVVDVFVD